MQARRSLADNLASQAAVDQGVTVLLILLAGIALALLLFAALRWARAARGPADRPGGGALAQPDGAEGHRRCRGACVAIGVAIAVGGRAWDQFSSSDIQFPNQPAAALLRLRRRRAPRLLQGRDRRLRRKAGPRPRRRHLRVLLGAAALDRPAGPRRPLALPRGVRRAGLVGGLLVLALVGSLLWCGLRRLARGAATRSASATRRCFAAMLAFAVGAAFDWFWEIAALGAVFFLAAGVAGRGPLRAARRRPPRRTTPAAEGGASAWPSPASPSPGSRRSPWSGRCWSSARSTPARTRRPPEDIGAAVDHAETARSIEPWAASPYVQLGLLAERQGDYPAAIEHFTRRDRARGPQLAVYYLRSRVEHEAGDEAAASADLERARD